MKQSTRRVLFTALTVIFLLAACAPAQPQTPNPEDVAKQVATSVALTVAAQALDTAEAQPAVTDTAVPTATPAVVDTPTPILSTATPLVLASPTLVPSGSGGGSTTRPAYACDIIHQRPFDYSTFKPGDRFDIKWTILNIGTKTMRDGLDLSYNQGPKLTTVSRVELPELAPGDEYDLAFDAVAPSKEGTYIMTYIVEGGLCYPYVAIKVER